MPLYFHLLYCSLTLTIGLLSVRWLFVLLLLITGVIRNNKPFLSKPFYCKPPVTVRGQFAYKQTTNLTHTHGKMTCRTMMWTLRN